jgi:Zn-dependent protease
MNLPISLDRIVSAIGNVARPYVLYSAATSSALATVSIVWMKADLMAGAAFVGAAWGGVALLYGAKAMENASVAKTNAAPVLPSDGGHPAQ